MELLWIYGLLLRLALGSLGMQEATVGLALHSIFHFKISCHCCCSLLYVFEMGKSRWFWVLNIFFNLWGLVTELCSLTPDSG